jgi:5-methylcytosine-specific restriction endonuclease McrA
MSILSDDQPLAERACTICGEVLPATAEYFYRSKKGKYGLRGECKKCRAALKKIYRAEHVEEIAAYRKQYYADHKEEEAASMRRYYEIHAEELKAYSREYYEEHKEEIAAKAKEIYAENKEEEIEQSKEYYWEHREERLIYAKGYRDEHKEKYLEYNRKYFEEHPEYHKQYRLKKPHISRERVRRRRAIKRNAEGGHTDAELQILYDWQQGLCCYCSRPIKNRLTEPPKTPDTFDGEHIVPLIRERATDWIWNIVLSCEKCNNTKGRKIALLEWMPPNLLPYMKDYLEDAIRRQGYELDME